MIGWKLICKSMPRLQIVSNMLEKAKLLPPRIVVAKQLAAHLQGTWGFF